MEVGFDPIRRALKDLSASHDVTDNAMMWMSVFMTFGSKVNVYVELGAARGARDFLALK